MSSIIILLTKGLSLNMKFIDSARLAGQKVPGICLCHPSQCWGYRHTHQIWLLHVFWKLNSCFHMCVATFYPLSPFPTLQKYINSTVTEPLTTSFSRLFLLLRCPFFISSGKRQRGESYYRLTQILLSDPVLKQCLLFKCVEILFNFSLLK